MYDSKLCYTTCHSNLPRLDLFARIHFDPIINAVRGNIRYDQGHSQHRQGGCIVYPPNPCNSRRFYHNKKSPVRTEAASEAHPFECISSTQLDLSYVGVSSQARTRERGDGGALSRCAGLCDHVFLFLFTLCFAIVIESDAQLLSRSRCYLFAILESQ
jgi:hypothetical protein